MSEQTMNNELRTRFNTQWASRTPVEWPNAEFIPPNPKSIYARFVITNGESIRLTFGTTQNSYRFSGAVFISLFVPENTGDSLILQRADEAAAIFRNWCGTNIVCRTPTVKRIGVTDGWYQVNVVIPFHRDELI